MTAVITVLHDFLGVLSGGVVGFLTGVGTGFLIWGRNRMTRDDAS